MSGRSIHNPREFTIDSLAAETGISVRNIRAYRNRGLLPAPEKRGRIGIYTDVHASRLRIIAELLERGFSIANIEELLSAWQSGRNLESVLGFETALTKPQVDEVPTVFNLTELKRLFGKQLTPELIGKIVDLDLLRLNGLQFIAPRPSMVEIGAALVKLGFPLADMLEIVSDLRQHLEQTSQSMVQIIERDMFGPAGASVSRIPQDPEQLAETIWELRRIVDKAVLSELGRSLDIAIKQRLGDILGQVIPSYAATQGKTPATRRPG